MYLDVFSKMFQSLVPSRLREFSKKKEGTLGRGIVAYALASIVGFILIAIGFYLGSSMVAEQIQVLLGTFGMEDFGVMGLFIYSVYGLVSGIGAALLYSYIGGWCAVRFFGGKGDWRQLFYVLMLVFGAIVILNGAFQLLGILGAWITMALAIIVSIYSFYLLYVATRAVYGISLPGTIACIIVAYLVLIVLYMLLVMALFAMFGPTGILAG